MTQAAPQAELQRLLSESPFNRFYGFQVRSAGDGECTLVVPFQPIFERPGGILGGQVFMAAADVAMWLAITAKLGHGERAVTVEIKTNFLSAARREDFTCHASILKLGNRLIYGVAECVNLEGKRLTHHTITYMRVGNEDSA